MKGSKMPSNADMEKAKRNIEVIREKMQKDADIFLLKEYHKLYRKNIPLFERSMAAAWLFMYYDKKETPPAAPARDLGRKAHTKETKEKKAPAPAEKPSALSDTALPESESKRLFFSIGKNRRLYPREVVTLIVSNTTAGKEDIGAVRILDNFSFVQVRDTKADEIIKALNGIKFRGRNLGVDYAKPKADAAVE